MILGVVGFLIIAAVVCSILSAQNPSKCPTWIATLLLAVALAVVVFPK